MNEQRIIEELFLFRNLKRLPDFTQLPLPTDFTKGADIYVPDDYHKALGVVLWGRAEAVSVKSEKAVLTSFGIGGVFGAAALFGDGEYVSCVRAVTDCRVQFLPESLLREWFAAYPEMALNYIAFLTDRVRFLNGKIAVYTCDGTAAKLYSWLSSNCDAEGALPKLSMTKLAAALHMGRTSLYRGLDELEKNQLIAREGGKVRVLR